MDNHLDGGAREAGAGAVELPGPAKLGIDPAKLGIDGADHDDGAAPAGRSGHRPVVGVEFGRAAGQATRTPNWKGIELTPA